MADKMITKADDLGFTTWTNSNDQFEKYPFNEYRMDFSEVINLSPALLDTILIARTSLPRVTLLDDVDVFGD